MHIDTFGLDLLEAANHSSVIGQGQTTYKI